MITACEKHDADLRRIRLERDAATAALEAERAAHRVTRDDLAALREAVIASRGMCVEAMSYGPSAPPGALAQHEASCEECQASKRLDAVLARTP